MARRRRAVRNVRNRYSPVVTFPYTSQILESRQELVVLLKKQFPEVHSIVMVTGPRTWAFADVYGKLIKSEWTDKISTEVLNNAPARHEVEELKERLLQRDERDFPDMIMYVGSQTVGDSTKALVKGLQSRYPDILFGGIITGLTGDGVFSSTASLRDDAGIPYSENAVPPFFIVGHKLTLLTQPFGMKASCVGDILAKISSLWDYNYSCRVLRKYHNDFAADLVHGAYDALLADPPKNHLVLHDSDAMDKLFRAVQLCGLSMQLTRSSETCSGSEHVGEKWLQEYIIRHNKARPNYPLRRPTHGAALIPLVIATLHMQGEARKAEEVKGIAMAVGLPTRATDLGLPATVLQMCLALGFGYRCPRYVAYILDDAEFPEDVSGERVTVLEQVEFDVLLQAIQRAIVDSGVGSPGDFAVLSGVHLQTMQDLAEVALGRLESEIAAKVGNTDVARRVRARFQGILPASYFPSPGAAQAQNVTHGSAEQIPR